MTLPAGQILREFAQLTVAPRARGGSRSLGLLRGQISVAEDFDAPLSESDLRAFEEASGAALTLP